MKESSFQTSLKKGGSPIWRRKEFGHEDMLGQSGGTPGRMAC